MESFEKILINQILPLVTKPGRYMGNEINVIKKDWSKVDVTFALVFPDLYELGMSYVGFDILYHILNRESNIAAERVFAPEFDLEKILKERGYHLFSLETKRFLHEFDLVGFTLQYELHYTNILNILELGGIALLAKDRENQAPIVLAGGPCAFNPEPLSDFIDAFIIGDGEGIVLEIARLVSEARAKKMNRVDILKSLSRISGVYVPQFYGSTAGNHSMIAPLSGDVPEKIQARVIESLSPSNYTDRPLVPLIETTHDRFSMEIMRGCSRGCRFCNAGIIYRPVRERPVDELIAQAESVIENTGYDEVSLVSLSTSDYRELRELLSSLIRILNKRSVNVSFPSLRSETFTPELAKFAKSVRKSGITLAPEAGTERLRKVINKNNTNDDLLRAVTLAFNEGWNLVKLYFMIGQPGEREEDMEGIVSLIQQVVSIANTYKDRNIHVSISPFTPKPLTPFQWAAQDSMAELNRKIDFLRDRIRSKRVKLSWRDPEVSFLEGVLGRGDRRLNAVIKRAWELGARFDAWSDHFNFAIWKTAFQESSIDPFEFSKERPQDAMFPWDHISKGITKSFLKREFKNALDGEETQDCRLSTCHACGLMEQPVCQDIIREKIKIKKPDPASSAFGRSKKMVQARQEPTIQLMRLKYTKNEEIRFTSHLDMIRIFERAFRRADINLAFTQGFNPHPKIAYGPPLMMGYSSEAEYLDIHLLRDREVNLRIVLNRVLPAGIEVIDSKLMYGKPESLVSIINQADYRIHLNKTFDQSYLKEQISEFLHREEIWVVRDKKGVLDKIDIKPFIQDITTDSYPDTILITTQIKQGTSARISEILREIFSFTDEETALSRTNRTGLFVHNGVIRLTPIEL